MRRCHDGADSGESFGNGGKCDSCSHHAFFEQLAREVHGEFAVANNDGRDWRFARRGIASSNVEPEQAEFFLPEAGVLPQLLDALRFLLKNIECRYASSGDRWRMRSRKQERPGAVI